MTVRDVLKDVARMVGDEELYDTLNAETENNLAATELKTKIMLKCFNDVLFETAIDYLPLETEEGITLGRVEYKSLSKTPIKIKKVVRGKESVKFFLGCDYFETETFSSDNSGCVIYEYLPVERSIDDLFEYDKTAMGKTGFCYGVAAEYCLISGRFSEAENWESRFKNAIVCAAKPRKRYGRIIADGGRRLF